MEKFKLVIILNVLLLFTACTDSYYEAEDFKSVSKIDTHVHIMTDNVQLIMQAEDNNFRLLTVNVDAPGPTPVPEQKEIAVNLESEYSERLSFLTTFEMEGWDAPEEWENKTIEYLEESFRQGAIGVKIWKNIGMVVKDDEGQFVMIDDPRFDPILDFIAQQDKTLLGHIGEPKNCWLPLEEMTTNNDREYFESHPEYHMYLHPEYPSYEKIIEARDRMLDKHLDLRFVGAHLGSMEWSIDMMADHLDKYPNVALETAARIPHLQYLTQQNREKVRHFFIEYQDRILYATDLVMEKNSDPEQILQIANQTWKDDWRYFVTDDTLNVSEVDGDFQGLKLPREVIDKIYRENAKKWYPGI